MKCHICDATLKVEEIKQHPITEEFEPCRFCLEVISEVFEDGLDEDEVTKRLEEEWGENYYADQAQEST